MKENQELVQDLNKKSYFHLIDGGVADNLGLRAVEESVDLVGNIWTTLQITGREKVRKVVFIVVNAETKMESMWNTSEFIPPLAAMISNYSTIGPVQRRVHGCAAGVLRQVDSPDTDGPMSPRAGLERAGILRRHRILPCGRTLRKSQG